MMAREGFYVQVLSSSNESEFPDNGPNYFKNRLPYPLRLPERGWQVGLSSIFLPDATLNLTKLSALTAPLLRARWLNVGHPEQETTNLTFADIKNDDNIVNGVTFMKALVMKYQQVVNYKRKDHGKMYTPTGKRLEFVFRWEGEELILDNSQLDLTKMTSNDEPFFIFFNQTLAEEMGWIIKKPGQPYGYAIGPNMNYDFQGDILPPKDLGSFSNNPFYFSIMFGTVLLSVYCNWRFTNLNLAFHNVVGNTARSLLVYSDVGGSSVVGNQVTDLLREVKFERTGKGINYFEPLHIQYLPVRNDTIDIIETQVSETDGDLTRFSEGDTIVTLHFKRT